MTLLVILGLVFLAVILMVILGERFGKPMEEQEQVKYSKWTRILVFALIIIAIAKLAFE
ncbi:MULTISPECIES: hypothetical protein [Thalassotalea]|uniref:Twin transmembrane helix small protein n=1 Tax=Thalassotalea castellviae TaxID=3075612 RepID=A0ABU3A3D6_9GAMM|nr:hypothetical protein [Thalassotalea sp. W431]MDT0604686.1 hypothetical protein [Thalassotalea sp. W431]